jgi:hypothetical protein
MDSKIIFRRGGALARGSCKWEGLSSGMTHFSAANRSNFHEWESASPKNLLVGFIRVHSDIRGSGTSGQVGRKAWFGYR